MINFQKLYKKLREVVSITEEVGQVYFAFYGEHHSGGSREYKYYIPTSFLELLKSENWEVESQSNLDNQQFDRLEQVDTSTMELQDKYGDRAKAFDALISQVNAGEVYGEEGEDYVSAIGLDPNKVLQTLDQLKNQWWEQQDTR